MVQLFFSLSQLFFTETAGECTLVSNESLLMMKLLCFWSRKSSDRMVFMFHIGWLLSYILASIHLNPFRE